METINKILELFGGIASNPVLFIVAIVVGCLAVFGGKLWISKLLKNWRKSKANSAKDVDKNKNIDELEKKHSDAATKVRDKLNELGQEE